MCVLILTSSLTELGIPRALVKHMADVSMRTDPEKNHPECG